NDGKGSQLFFPFPELSCQQLAENGVEISRGIKVALKADAVPFCGVVVAEDLIHISRERGWSLFLNFAAKELFESHRWGTKSSFQCVPSLPWRPGKYANRSLRRRGVLQSVSSRLSCGRFCPAAASNHTRGLQVAEDIPVRTHPPGLRDLRPGERNR